ncbi:hypothetical protein WMO40_12630 [Bacillaceae bacterium CLA-AA-H227]|uniref:Uncharacterized protein n=1 Tax=Robertmurraya yapensis (ex Hitch et al 2024) TaxID=3133160 RepID=A0ACC6SBZ5_9BACI
MKKFLVFIICLIILSTACSNKDTKGVNSNNNVYAEDISGWSESATLIRKIATTENGDTEESVFRIGDNGKLGIGEYGPFITGKSQKYMWHFWGNEKTLLKPFKVVGISKDSDTKITLFELPKSTSLAPVNGASHSLPSTLKLPEPGLWKLEAYFGEELFGSITVLVQDK